MASNAIEFRLREAERQLAELQATAAQFKEKTAQLQGKIEALRRSLTREEPGVHLSDQDQPGKTPPASATPPPLPPPAPAPPPPVAPTARPPRPAHAPATPSPAATAPISVASATPRVAPTKDRAGLELELGRVWFVRIGIGLLLTGFVFLSTYAYQNFIVNWSAGARVATLYTGATLLAAVGIFLEHWKESLRNYGRVVAAGGWAAIYYTTYAAHHVERLRVIEGPVLAAVLLSLAALGFFAYAAWKKSSTLAVGALILAFYATALNPMGWLGCFSGLLLSAIGMVFFLRYRWLQTGIASLLGAYLSYTYWQGFVNSDAVNDPTRWFLVGYWLLFMACILAPQARQQKREFLVKFASANNILFFVLFSFQFDTFSWVPDLWLNALVFGAVLLGISIALGRLREYPPLLGEVFLAKGLALLTWGLSLKLTGYHLFLTLTLEAVVLAFLWRRSHTPVLRAFTWGTALLATGLAAWSLPGIQDVPGLEILEVLQSIQPGAERAPDLAYLTQGALLALLAFLMRGAPFLDEKSKLFSLEATAASLLALLLPSAAILIPLPTAQAGLWMLGIGLVLWSAYMVIPSRWPLPELVWLAQPFALGGGLLILAGSPTVPQLGFCAAAAALALQLHGWASDRKSATIKPAFSLASEAVFTGLFLFALAYLIFDGVDSPNARLLLFALLPLAGHFYGSFLARPFLASFSQFLYLPALFLAALSWSPSTFGDAPSQFGSLVAVFAVLAHLVAIHLVPRLKLREVFRETHLVVAATLWAGWCVAFIDPWWLVLAWTGCALSFLPTRFQAKLHLATSLAFVALGVISLALFETEDFWLRYLALPAAFLLHFVQSRRDETAASANPRLWTGLAIGIVAALVVIASQHTLSAFDGRGLSICWALLGLALFGLGLAAKVRAYRLGGLAVLTLSLGHVLAVDVWKLETVLRIFSFLTLGLVLLALGFVYNRWHASLRKLL